MAIFIAWRHTHTTRIGKSRWNSLPRFIEKKSSYHCNLLPVWMKGAPFPHYNGHDVRRTTQYFISGGDPLHFPPYPGSLASNCSTGNWRHYRPPLFLSPLLPRPLAVVNIAKQIYRLGVGEGGWLVTGMVASTIIWRPIAVPTNPPRSQWSPMSMLLWNIYRIVSHRIELQKPTQTVYKNAASLHLYLSFEMNRSRPFS